MKALQFSRKPARFAAATVAGRLTPGGGARVGPLSLKDVDPPPPPSADWVRVRPRLAGICGSDLATIDGRSSRYFDPIVSFPFTPGHEVVGDLDDGRRVVIEPVLGCVTRNIDPPCDGCASGRLGRCEHVSFGALEPGLQSGFCCDTGGGWSTAMVAHPSQLHDVPDPMGDEAAVMVEPTACAVHGALAGGRRLDGGVVVVLGAGTLGLLVTAAVDHLADAAQLLVVAKHPVQRRFASELGADAVVSPGELTRAVRRATGTMAIADRGDGDARGRLERLCGGADVVLDCVGSADSLTQALGVVRPGGRIVMVGMPGTVTADLTGLWHREVELVGAYAYGTETLPAGSGGGAEGNATDHASAAGARHQPDEAHASAAGARHPTRTFDLAFELVQAADLGRLVSATYPLDRYAEAVEHAAGAGRRGAVKIAFDLRHEKERNR